MATSAPTNDCFAAMASATANVTSMTEILTLPLFAGSDSCSPIDSVNGLAVGAVDSLHRAMTSMDLSFDVPEHPSFDFAGGIGLSLRQNSLSGKYEVTLPDRSTLAGAFMGFCSALFFGLIFATILYHSIVKYEKKKEKLNLTLRKAVIGPILLLTAILLPYPLVDFLGYDNTAVRFTTCLPFALFMFRILEAVFGFVPAGAKSSYGTYCAYFSLPFDMMFDAKTNEPIMATEQDVRDGQVDVAKSVACIVALCSVLSPFGYAPFGESNAGEFHEGIVMSDYLDYRHLGNCFAIAFFFQQGLALGFCIFGNSIQTILGYKVKRSMRNPLLEATSPSDFWGRRWNVLVHAVMKRGVYKPVRKHLSSAVVASLAVFVASGMFHEWLVHICFLYNQPSSTSTGVLLGSNVAFFVWNFLVIVGEKLVTSIKSFKSFGTMVPSIFVPFFIVMTSLPVAHWFGSPFMNGGFFGDYEKCLILIRKVQA